MEADATDNYPRGRQLKEENEEGGYRAEGGREWGQQSRAYQPSCEALTERESMHILLDGRLARGSGAAAAHSLHVGRILGCSRTPDPLYYTRSACGARHVHRPVLEYVA